MFSDNLKYLRAKHKISQSQLSAEIDIPRTTLGDYERGKTEPSIYNMLRISSYFSISIDDLLKKRLTDEEMVILQNDRLKVLAVSLDQQNRQNIELVESQARAGYLESFADPEYIKELPKITIPGLEDHSYRAFSIQGDSMLPMESGSIVVCRYIENLDELKDDKCYVIVSKSEGLVYKRIANNPNGKSITLISDNSIYHSYDLHYEQIDEIWEYRAHIGFSDNRAVFDDMLDQRLADIQVKVSEIHSRLK